MPPMESTCPDETPIFMDVFAPPDSTVFCFAFDDPMVTDCFVEVDIKCQKSGYFSGCRKYHYCKPKGDGTFTKTSYMCPMPKVYSEKYGACVDVALAPECSPWGGCPEEPGYHRDPQDCNKFYQCGLNATGNATATDMALEFECPDSMYFSVKEGDGTCVPWQSAEKCDFQVDPGSGTPSEEKACKKAGVMSDPAELPTAEPPQMFIMCFPIGDGKFGGVKGTCMDISATAMFVDALKGCFEPCAA